MTPHRASPACRAGLRRAAAGMALAAALALLLAAGCSRQTPESLLATAKAASQQRDHKAAVISLKAALQLDPQNLETRLLLGQEMLKAGDPAGAAIELTKLRDAKMPDERVLPPLSRALLLLGDERRLATLYGDVELKDKQAQADLKANIASAFAALGDRPRTEAALKVALELAPEHTVANVLKARILAGGGDLAGGLKLAQSVVDRAPGAYEAWHLIGELHLYGDGDRAKANEAFRKSLAIEPANVQAHLALLAMAIRARDIAAARAQAEELRKVLPRHPQMVFVDAQLAFHDGKFARARELTQALLKVAPNHTGILQLAGAVQAESGAFVVAETHFVKALQINPALAMPRRNLAQIYLRLGQPVRALDALKPLIDNRTADSAALSLAAEAYLVMGDADRAEQLFGAAARLTPDDEKIRTALALSHLTRGDADKAFLDLERVAGSATGTYAEMAIVSARIKRQEYDKALVTIDAIEKKASADKTLAPLLRGRVHVLRGDLAAARAAFEQALVVQPDYFTAVSNLAALELREGRFDAALARFDQAIRADARNHMAYIGKAEVLIRQRKPLAEVRKVLDEAIQAAPNEADPRLQLIEYAMAQRQFKDALVVAQQAGAALPNHPKILDAVGRAQAQTGDRLQALSSFQRAANLDPGAALPHVRMADLFKGDGKRSQAIAAFKRALEIDPRLAEAQVGLVDMLAAENRFDEAVAVARSLQSSAAAIEGGYLLEAGLHARQRNPARAEAALRAGLKVHPTSSQLAIRLHQVLSNAGRRDDANRFAAQWVRDNPRDSAVGYQLATDAILRGDLADAESRLREIVERHPQHPLALNNLAWVLTTTGKPGAVPFAERALARMPAHTGIQDTLAMALAAEGQAARALEIQQKAIAADPDNDGLRLNLAKIALKAGDAAMARRELEAIVAKGPLGAFHGEASKLLKTL